MNGVKLIVVFLAGILSTLIVSLIGIGITVNRKTEPPQHISNKIKIEDKKLERFSFSELARTQFEPEKIEIESTDENTDKYEVRKIFYKWEGRRISGQLTVPKGQGDGPFPVVVMIRGFVDPSEYSTGVGTRNAARAYATAGFLTVATDFLGYGESDKPENDIWWERFSKPSQVLQLIASLSTIPEADTTRIGLWGHSNGGQLALSIKEITGKGYPTTLWAPVSAPFPYSILFFTDDSADEGQELRRELANFEWSYDVRNYSVSSYWDRISGPIQLHQGSADPDVPQKWSDNLNRQLKKLDKKINYFVYPGADHNLRPSWQVVVDRDIVFFKEHLITQNDTE